MTKPDFTRTSAQVERDILALIDTIDRSLDSSNGESERKGHFVMSAFLSVLAVFGSILGIQHFVGAEKSSSSGVSVTDAPIVVELDDRDVAQVRRQLGRIQAQTQLIRLTKTKVAPAMPIDGNLQVIDNSANDLFGLFGIQKDQM